MNKELKKLFVNTVLIAFGNLGAKMIGFLLLPVYTSILSTESYGVYDFIITLSSFLIPIVSINIYESLFRFLITAKQNDDEVSKNKIISSSLSICLVAIIIYIFISMNIYFITKNNYIFLLTLYVISSIVYLLFISLLRGMEQIKYYAFYSGLKNFCQVIFSYLAIAKFDLGISGLLYASILPSIVIAIIILFHFKLYKFISFNYDYIQVSKRLIRYSLPLVPDSISATLLTMSDRIIVKSFIGDSANGIYSIAHKFPSIIEVMYHFYITSWNESASRTYEQDEKTAKEYYTKIYLYTKNFLISGGILLLALMPLLFNLLINGDYVQAFEYTPYLLVAQILNCIANFYSGILIAYKDTKSIAKSTIFASLLNVVLNMILVFKLGIIGVLYATLVSNIFLVILRKIQCSKYIELKENIFQNVLSFIILLIIFALYNYNNIICFLINVFVSLIFFIVANRQVIIKSFEILKRKIGGRL